MPFLPADTAIKNVVVLGASYVGIGAAQKLAATLPEDFQVILIEPNSHFMHLFAFPRFAVLPSHEHKAFIPLTGVFPSGKGTVVRAKAAKVEKDAVVLDREWQGRKRVPYEYLIIATGTKLPSPSSLKTEDKKPGVAFFQSYQLKIKRARKICLLGAGAVGVQLATDIKELYPDKDVTIIHSRNETMSRFDPRLHYDYVAPRCRELGIELLLRSRAVIPAEGFPEDGSEYTVSTQDGRTVTADLFILTTGQTPSSDFVKDLGIVNEMNRFIRIKPTLQVDNDEYTNVFAVGDVADTQGPKAARPATKHVDVVVANICKMIQNDTANLETFTNEPAAIHLTLGLTKNMIFRNPGSPEEQPIIKLRDDGQANMGIEGVWARRGVKVAHEDDYHL